MSKVTAGINRINQELDKISGMDGIAADKIAELETYVKEMVSDLLEYHSEANVFNYDGNNCCKEKSVTPLIKTTLENFVSIPMEMQWKKIIQREKLWKT